MSQVEVIDGEIYGLYTALEEKGYAVKKDGFDEMIQHIQHKLDKVAQDHLREHLIELCGDYITKREKI